jgi:hypothetical protein
VTLVSQRNVGTPEQSEYLLYEIQMLCALADYFETGELDDAVKPLPHEGLPARNAAVEAFAVHARQLIEFLDGHDDRDMAAADFTRGPWSPPSSAEELRELRERFSKQVVHLSRERATYSAEERRVLSHQIREQLGSEFRRCVDARQAMLGVNGWPVCWSSRVAAIWIDPHPDAGIG